jgi:mono/diheme cytochrome c family protein
VGKSDSDRKSKGNRVKRTKLLGVAIAAALLGGAGPDKPSVQGPSQLAVGEYLVTIGGCNDCHTAGWNQNPGKVPVAERLTGNPVGWNGPWGTSYAINLRLLVQKMSADAWVRYIAVTQPRPPMPWFNVRSLSEPDLRAIYAYIHSLGPAGEPMPDALPPGVTPKTPYLEALPHAPG